MSAPAVLDPHLQGGLTDPAVMRGVSAKLARGRGGGCILWAGYLQAASPTYRYRGAAWQVRRLLLAESGVLVPARSEVHRSCDEPRCVAPQHAFVINLGGTGGS